MNQTRITSGHWRKQLDINARAAIFHQWRQLVDSGCIENFRIAAGESDAFREGWFFADSDAYKWLEAAVLIQAEASQPGLAELVDAFTGLLGRAQAPDGYLFTYNQIHFPGMRWQNLQIEHELYCHGHLIEACVSHFEATASTQLLDIARKAAGRIVEDFAGKGPEFTPGHEEIEIALLRLHQAAPDGSRYLDLARQFIQQRGRIHGFLLHLLRQNARVESRKKEVQRRKAAYLGSHSGYKPFPLPPGNYSPRPPGSALRWAAAALSGKFQQQNRPIDELDIPVGHAVRFAYLQAAAARLCRQSGDQSLLPVLEKTWERMVTRRMYITGGIGSVPVTEGFGRDYELDPAYAYAETCAAIGCLLWNREMSLLTRQARYADLFEWQLYNAVSPGMGLTGDAYFYNNPLSSRGGVTRRAWFAVPCCPSNISRTWAGLGEAVFSTGPACLYVNQYIGSEIDLLHLTDESGHAVELSLRMGSGLPWTGAVSLEILHAAGLDGGLPVDLTIHLRQPSWSAGMHVSVNGTPWDIPATPIQQQVEAAASGFDPRLACWQPIRRGWTAGDRLDINFEMPVTLRSAHPRVAGHTGRAAVSCGPLVYCLESVDNPGLDIFNEVLNRNSLAFGPDAEGLPGAAIIDGKTRNGLPLRFIPYYLWGNRGPSTVNTWMRC